jgi:hypothetical protein
VLRHDSELPRIHPDMLVSSRVMSIVASHVLRAHSHTMSIRLAGGSP